MARSAHWSATARTRRPGFTIGNLASELEDIAQRKRQRRDGATRLPCHVGAGDNDVFRVSSHDRERSLLRVDYPVLLDAYFYIEASLLISVSTPRVGRGDLDNEDRDWRFDPTLLRIRVRLPNHEIRLSLRSSALQDGPWSVDISQTLGGNVRIENARESG